jgi:hypothetical protein
MIGVGAMALGQSRHAIEGLLREQTFSHPPRSRLNWSRPVGEPLADLGNLCRFAIEAA